MDSSKPKIAVIVPTIREANFATFIAGWFELFQKHDVTVFKVADGDDPRVHSAEALMFSAASGLLEALSSAPSLRRSELPDEVAELFSDHNPACRNLGFYEAASRLPKFEIFLTLDDDCLPPGGEDPIAEHLAVFMRRWPLSWFSTTGHELYMRGFPYAVRCEAEAVVSHGLWLKNPDLDAVGDLFIRHASGFGNPDVIASSEYYSGPVPRGVFMNFCGMNCAFTREALPHYYHCPVENFLGAERFDDIWMGIELKKQIDLLPNKCIVSGCAMIEHTRASDPFLNLAKEAVGIPINETLWRGEVNDQYKPFMEMWADRRSRYANLLKPLV